MRLSVVLVNWNARDDLRACLASLENERREHADLEVIVCDNGSKDDSVAIMRAEFSRVIVIDAGENLGFAEGCNRGIAKATGEWVVMLNNDTTVDPGWARALVDAAEHAEPTCGMLQCVMLFAHDANTINSTGIVLDTGGSGHDRHGGERYGDVRAEEIFCPTAGAAAYRRSMLDAIALPTGVFDRDHFMYSEDLDLGWRARLAGFSAKVVPGAVVRHKHMASTKKRGREWLVVMSRTNRLRTLLKNASPSFFVRALPRTVYEMGEIAWYGGPKAAAKLPSVIAASLRARRAVERIAHEDRRDVEKRWVVRR